MKENLKVIEQKDEVLLEDLLTPINIFVHFYLKHYRTIDFYDYYKCFYGFLSGKPEFDGVLGFASMRNNWMSSFEFPLSPKQLDVPAPSNERLYFILAEKMLNLKRPSDFAYLMCHREALLSLMLELADPINPTQLAYYYPPQKKERAEIAQLHSEKTDNWFVDSIIPHVETLLGQLDREICKQSIGAVLEK